MEKGFNDDELADIMNEIESLEKEFAQEDESVETEIVETQAVAEDELECVDDAHEEVEEVHAMQHQEEPVAEQMVDEEMHEHEMSEVLGELSKMPVDDITPSAKHEPQASLESEEHNIHHIQKAPTSKDRGATKTAMSFHVEGDMRFELSFHIAGKFVGLTVTEEGLEIGLDGGVKFTVPVDETSASHKKAS